MCASDMWYGNLYIEHNIYNVNLETFKETLVVYNWWLEQIRI
jgi:hypothetical protein